MVLYVVCYGVHLCAGVRPGSLPDGVLKQRDDRDDGRGDPTNEGSGRAVALLGDDGRRRLHCSCDLSNCSRFQALFARVLRLASCERLSVNHDGALA